MRGVGQLAGIESGVSELVGVEEKFRPKGAKSTETRKRSEWLMRSTEDNPYRKPGRMDPPCPAEQSCFHSRLARAGSP